ncbi:MAG: hypothetical protein NVSMB69_07660 [Novosphingobium sp.]|jgi:hypothetical protein
MESSHIVSLQTKHAGLERKIAAEMARPLPDDVLVTELKRRKLKLKEAIVQVA